MRIDVNKYLVIGPWSLRSEFFRRTQELGIIEFISNRPPSLETPPDVQTFVQALHILRQMPPVKEGSEKDYRSANVLARETVDIAGELEHLRESRRIVEKDISRIEVFGDFSIQNLKDLEKESGKVFQFFFAKKSELLEAPKRPEVIYVGSAHGLDYFMSINKERRSYDGLIEMMIDRSLGELRDNLAGIQQKIDESEITLSRLAHNKKLLQQGLAHALNIYHLEDSKDKAQLLLDGEVFAVEGWIPKNKVAPLMKLADELNIHVEPIATEEKDRIPTYLENKGVARLGEDLVHIYDTPSRTDRDPSRWVFFAFAVFFSMIIADAGYGLILLGLSLFLMFKFGKKNEGLKRVLRLSTYLSLVCILWGVLSASFFGIDFAPNSKFKKLSLVNWMVEQKAEYFLAKKPASYDTLVKEYPDLKDAKTPQALLTTVQRDGKFEIYNEFSDNVLIELAIFLGTIHIILSFLRYMDRNWAGAGWILFIIGSYLFFPSILGAVSLIHYVFHVPYEEGTLIGKYLLYSGLGATVILALIQKRLGGLAEIMNVIQVFADIMSYLRIYALSLAGMIMAATFNEIGGKAPIYLGIFIILAGHLINLTLAIMGGVIHGLRLNFIEWYHYSFEGGGKMFNPLKLIKLD